MSPRSLTLALLLLLGFASGAVADKTLTYFAMTLTDVTSVRFDRNAASPTGWVVSAQGIVRASSGGGYSPIISSNATAGQKTAIENFITNNVVPALNTQEGL